jgi:spermidine synthase
MKNLKFLLSYIYPVPVKITSSRHNPFLEIVLSDGKYTLNSRNTNYSFGTLHTLFKKTFRKLKIDWQKIETVLILGFGAGSISEIIINYSPGCQVDGVEIDEKVIELGRKYFKTDTNKNLTLHCTPADKYIEECHKKYDLIIIDVFLDMVVPQELESEQFLLRVRDCLKPGGWVIFNKVIYTKSIGKQIAPLMDLYQKIFVKINILTVMKSGKIFVARN